MNEPEWQENGSGADEPARERLAAMEARMVRLESALSALHTELSSVREQLSAAGWKRASVRPAPHVVRPPVSPAAVPGVLERASKEAAAGERTESLESRLGSRVLSKVAVVLLLAGAAWFLKWAFDNHWVGPAGRVLVGLLAGAGVVVWSERFRRQAMAAFSYALKAVGTGVLYLSLWAGFQLYHLMPAPVALLAMIAVTAANGMLAFTQDSPLLAGYALLGAYITPALLSTGGNYEVFLFSYLLVVAVFVAVMVRLRPWHLLLCAALPMTVAYYIGWYVSHFGADEEGITLLFTVLLWAAFAVVPVIAKEADGVIVGVLMPMAAAAFGSLAVYSVLVDSGGRAWEAWWALLFAAAYLGLMRVRRGGLVAAIHLSLVVVFLTITIPLKATGRGITVGWLAEAVALLWVATLPQADHRASKALRLLGCASLLLGVGGVLLGPLLPFGHSEPAFFNRDFAISLGALLALAAAAVVSLRKREGAEVDAAVPVIAAGAFVLGNVVLLVAMGREIHTVYAQNAASRWELESELSDFTFSGWLMLQGVANLLAGFMRRVALARWAGLLLLGVTLIKVFAYDMRSLGAGYHVLSYFGLGVVLMAVSFAYQKDWLGLREAVASGEPVPAGEAQR